MTTINMETSAVTARQGFVTQPRAIVMIDGISVICAAIGINTAQFGYADTWEIEFPLAGQPQPIDRSYFANNQTVTVEIYIGYPANPNNFTTQDLDLLAIGNSDQYEDDLCSNFMVINGRDLTGLLIDDQVTQRFPNQTASQIVTMFANQQGLTPQVTATTTPVGNFYVNQQTFLANQMSQWDLITFFAQQENFVAFVQGNTLIFEPNPSTNISPYVINYQPATSQQAVPFGNFDQCRIITNSTITGNVQVTVRSPVSTKTGKGFSTTVKARNKKNKKTASKKFVYRKPGLTPQQSQKLTQQLLKQHTSQGVGISLMLAGDNILKKDSVIQLKGTGTDYDQLYYPDQIERRFSFSPANYSMNVYARNKSKNLEVTS